MELKHCPKCNRDLTKENFSKNAQLKDGLSCWCKECRHNSYIQNKEKRAKWSKEYVEKKIQEEYDGTNIKQLAKKYSYTERWVSGKIKNKRK